MTNHPNRNPTAARFVAFSTITGTPEAYAATAALALAKAIRNLPNADFIEVLDCGENGRKIWSGGVEPPNPVPLHKARELHPTVFRGTGYDA